MLHWPFRAHADTWGTFTTSPASNAAELPKSDVRNIRNP